MLYKHRRKPLRELAHEQQISRRSTLDLLLVDELGADSGRTQHEALLIQLVSLLLLKLAQYFLHQAVVRSLENVARLFVNVSELLHKHGITNVVDLAVFEFRPNHSFQSVRQTGARDMIREAVPQHECIQPVEGLDDHDHLLVVGLVQTQPLQNSEVEGGHGLLHDWLASAEAWLQVLQNARDFECRDRQSLQV